MKIKCIECGEITEGRIDKKYCTPYCKSSYHYKNDNKGLTLFKKIDKQLKLNRRLLKKYNMAGKAIIRKKHLLNEGFNPKHFTHYWKADNGAVYLFCYEFGFMEKKEHDVLKLVLVQWQDYMNKSL